MSASTQSPAFNSVMPGRCTTPSISGASAIVRPMDPVSDTESMSTVCVLPTFCCSFCELIDCCNAMNCSQRACFTSSGTGSGSSLAAAPFTGEYWKQPTRSNWAASMKRNSSSNSVSVSPGNPTRKVERTVRSGQRSRHRAIRSKVFSEAAGRFMRCI